MSRAAVLTDAQWQLIEPLMPSSDGKQGNQFRDHRQVVEGIIYRFRSGLAWRDLPGEFGTMADGVETAPPVHCRWDLGQDPYRAAHPRRRDR